MSRLSLFACAALSAFVALAAQPAASQSAVIDEAVSKNAGAPPGTAALASTPLPIVNSLLGPGDLTDTGGNVPVAAASGFDTEDWNLDENVGGPMVSLTDKALVAKGYPTLEAMGADTQAMQQGMSMDGGSVPTGSVLSSAPLPAVVSSLVGGILPK